MEFINKHGFVLNARIVTLFLIWFLITTVSGIQFVRHFFVPNTGLISDFPECRAMNGMILYSPRDPFMQQIASSLAPDEDAILAIGHKSVGTMKDLVDALFSLDNYAPVPLRAKNREGSERTVVIEPMMNILRFDWVFTLVFLLASSVVAFFLIFKFHHRIEYNIASMVALLYMLYTSSKPFYLESLFSFTLLEIGYLAPWFIGALGLYFPSKKGTPTVRLFAITFAATLMIVFIILKSALFIVWKNNGSDSFYQLIHFTEQITQVAHVPPLIGFLALGVHSYLASLSSQEKRQLEWTLFGFVLALTPFFFFEKLPFLLGDYIGERISIGNFSHLFLSIFPVFFLIGVVTNRSLNVRLLVGRTVIVTISLLLLYFGYLVLLPRVSGRNGLFLLSLLFLSIGFVLMYAGDAILRRILELKYDGYCGVEKKRYTSLLAEHERLSAKTRSEYQKEKIDEIGSLFRGIYERVRVSDGKLMKSVVQIEKQFKKLYQVLQKGALVDHHEMMNLKAESEKELLVEKESIIFIREVFARLESAISLKPSIKNWVRVTYLLKLAIADIEKKYDDADIDIEASTQAKIYCVQHELTNVLREIVFNAIESQPDTFGRVQVKLRSDASRVVIEVIDSGRGIPDSRLRKIRSPFHSTKDGHLGLGLYLCATYVEHNEGTMSVSCAKDRGTMVVLSFPAEQLAKK